ncbi:hypothetical protein QJS66_20775 [Kocuria rhizophila]|nr:hypothetical protein QJS66_20775 [Kocuria rhizophila]
MPSMRAPAASAARATRVPVAVRVRLDHRDQGATTGELRSAPRSVLDRGEVHHRAAFMGLSAGRSAPRSSHSRPRSRPVTARAPPRPRAPVAAVPVLWPAARPAPAVHQYPHPRRGPGRR